MEDVRKGSQSLVNSKHDLLKVTVTLITKGKVIEMVVKWHSKQKRILKNVTVDSSWVVSYSSPFAAEFKTHMNVDLCISKVGSIEYHFK